jgi:ribosome-associated translation inhibitor RaiA
MTVLSAPDVVVRTRGAVRESAVGYAAEKVARVVHLAPAPVLSARVELHEHPNPSVDRSSLAGATLEVSGRAVRAQAVAETIEEAIDLVEDRLRRRLEVMSSRLDDRQRRTAVAVPGQWRHGDRPTERGVAYPRPVEEREVVRRGTYDDEPLAVEEAVYELHLLDYDFMLFVDSDTGEDSLLYAPADGGYLRLARGTQPTPRTTSDEPPVVDSNPAPDMTVDQARERLDAGGGPFVFFRESTSGRGCVMYQRFDGHYGLITPAAPT